MRPLIGLSCSHDSDKETSLLNLTYSRGVEKAGGLPVVLPLTTDKETLSETLSRLDGLLLTGGPDLDPSFFGEEPWPRLGAISPDRDTMELHLTKQALSRDMPLFGICRGIQTLNVAAGGSLIQDIPSAVKEPLKHRQEAPRWHGSHSVAMVAGSRLAAILGVDSLRVNTFHHQAVQDLAEGFAVAAHAPDGVIEAIESTRHRFAIGVQWHPEGMWERHSVQLRLFSALVRAASQQDM